MLWGCSRTWVTFSFGGQQSWIPKLIYRKVTEQQAA